MKARSKGKRQSRPRPDSATIADYAWANTTCPACGAEPKSACVPLPQPPRTVCKERFIAGAIMLKHARKAASPSPEAAESMARLDLATERGCFMREVPDADVAKRLREGNRS